MYSQADFTYSEFVQHSLALRDLEEEGENYDFTVKIKDRKFRFQRSILEDRSDFFKVLYESDFCEQDKDEIELLEVPTIAAMQVIQALIDDVDVCITPEILCEVADGVDYLQINSIFDSIDIEMFELLYKSMTKTTWHRFQEIVETIEGRFKEALSAATTQWKRDHFDQIWSSPTFSKLPKDLQDCAQYGKYKGKETFAICCMDYVENGDESHATQETRSTQETSSPHSNSSERETKSGTKGKFKLQNLRLNVWHETSSSWETVTTVPPEILKNLSTMPAVFSVNDRVILMNAELDRFQQNRHSYYYNLEEHCKDLYLLRFPSLTGMATMYLDTMYCYSIRKGVWEVLHPTTPTRSLQFRPSLLYPVQMGHNLHLIVQGMEDTPGQHLCFNPVECKWYNQKPAPLPENHREGSAIIGAGSNGDTHILALSCGWYLSDEWNDKQEMNRCIYYSLFDDTKETWTRPKKLASNVTGPNIFLITSESDEISIHHPLGSVFNIAYRSTYDTVSIDCNNDTFEGFDSITNNDAFKGYGTIAHNDTSEINDTISDDDTSEGYGTITEDHSENDDIVQPFYSKDTTMSIAWKTYGCAIQPKQLFRTAENCKPRLYDPGQIMETLPNPPSTLAESKWETTTLSTHVELSENDSPIPPMSAETNSKTTTSPIHRSAESKCEMAASSTHEELLQNGAPTPSTSTKTNNKSTTSPIHRPAESKSETAASSTHAQMLQNDSPIPQISAETNSKTTTSPTQSERIIKQIRVSLRLVYPTPQSFMSYDSDSD